MSDGNNKPRKQERDSRGQLLPGSGGSQKRLPTRRMRITDHLNELADEFITDEKTRGRKLAEQLWDDAMSDCAHPRIVTSARQIVLERIDPPPKEVPQIVPTDITIYDQRAITFLTELERDCKGVPTTQDVLNHLRRFPLPPLGDDD